jgi:hypothetical protein
MRRAVKIANLLSLESKGKAYQNLWMQDRVLLRWIMRKI